MIKPQPTPVIIAVLLGTLIVGVMIGLVASAMGRGDHSVADVTTNARPDPAPAAVPAAISAKPAAVPADAAASVTPSKQATVKQISSSTTVPTAFRGRWDEDISDGCREREARFFFEKAEVYNFEVESRVSRVTLDGPMKAKISISGFNYEGKRYDETLAVQLTQGGKAIRINGDGTLYRKCPG